MMRNPILLLPLALVTTLWSGNALPDDCTACDESVEMMDAHEAYARAWRDNDADAVIAAFAEDFTLSPAGMPFLEGEEAARAFWWPPGSPPARIIDFQFEPIQYSASAVLGYVRGHYSLEFEYEGKLTAARGKFLTILERGPDGWKIKHHYWDTLPTDSGS